MKTLLDLWSWSIATFARRASNRRRARPRLSLAVLTGVVAVSGCASHQVNDDDGVSADALDDEYAPASAFNKSGLTHSKDGHVVQITGLLSMPLVTYNDQRKPIGSIDRGDLKNGPGDGNIRVATLERLGVGSDSMYRVWPRASSNQGWIVLTDVTTDSPVHEEKEARHGNGAPCPTRGAGALTSAKYIIQPRQIRAAAAGAAWKIQSGGGEWYTFQPDWDKPAGPDRVFLMWSWTPTDHDGRNVGFHGGGVTRAEMFPTDEFTPCKVKPIRTVVREMTVETTPDDSARKLSVYAAYGKFAHDFYGWTIIASRLEGDQCLPHVACADEPAKCSLDHHLPYDCNLPQAPTSTEAPPASTGAPPASTGAPPASTGAPPVNPPVACHVLCCEPGTGDVEVSVADDDCILQAQTSCDQHGHVQSATANGTVLYTRVESTSFSRCWSKCSGRKDYHEVVDADGSPVTQDCAAKAKDWCHEVTSRGSFQDAMWDRCVPD